MKEDFGFKFNYSNHHIGKSEPLNENDIFVLGEESSNNQNMYVECKQCGILMDYISGSDGFGYWKCPICRTRVRETTVYN